MDLISLQGLPHKHILTWSHSVADTLSFLDDGDGNSIEREGMVGLFECGVRIGGVPHFYNMRLAWCVELCVDLPEVETAC